MQSAHFGGRHRKDAMAVNKSGISHSIPVLPAYRTVWRWHFYAGIICIPFVLWLAVTGSIYLFKPQIDAFIDRPYANLTPSGPRASAHAQVAAALAAVPGGTLYAYQLPHSERSAVQILVAAAATSLASTSIHGHSRSSKPSTTTLVSRPAYLIFMASSCSATAGQ